MQFIEYPKCSTCKKAKKYLEENHISFLERSIIEETPTKKELKEWIKKYSLDCNKLFNTSGILYREWNLKEKIPHMSEDEKIKLLSENGMLIKRPLLIDEDKIIIGYQEKEYEKLTK